MGDANSAKIKIAVRTLQGDEDLCRMVKLYEDVTTKVFPGLALTTGVAQRAIVNNLTTENAKALSAAEYINSSLTPDWKLH